MRCSSLNRLARRRPRRPRHWPSTLLLLALIAPAVAQDTRADDPPPPKPGESLFDFGKDPLKPGAKPKAAPTTKPARIGQAEVKVVSTKLDHVTLVPSTEHGPAAPAADRVNSQDKFLAITLEIRNTHPDRPLTYHTFAFPHGPTDNPTYASLALGRKMLTLVNFGEQEPLGLTRKAEIPPGKTVTDVLVFLPAPELDAAPATGTTPLKLALPPQQLGEPGRPIPLELDLANLKKRR